MRRPPLRCAFAGLLGLLLALACCSPAHAYSWMIKHGFAKCNTCHTDPSGGEALNGMGRAQARELLSWGGDRGTPASAAHFLLGALPEPPDVRLGGSYRHLLLYTAAEGGSDSALKQFPMQLDVYASASLDVLVLGASLGVARGITGSAHARGAQLNRELGEGWLLLSRTHFVGARFDDHTWLRLGRLNLPFGLRIPEHVAWVRETTRTDRESDQQHGLALAYSAGRVRLEGMVIAGNFQLYPDRYRERGYSLSIEYSLNESSALGVSSLLTRANEDRFTQAKRALRYAEAITARIGLSPRWVLCAEADLLKQGGRGIGYAGWAQGDFEPWRGLHFMLSVEGVDQGALDGGAPSSPGSGEPRLGLWASAAWYLYSHLELRLDLVQRQASPLTVQAQLHAFL